MKRILFFMILILFSCNGGVPAMKKEIADLMKTVRWEKSSNMYGSTCVSFRMGGKLIYVDPSDLVSKDKLEKADYIFVTHDHGDHFNPGMISVLSRDGTVVILPTHMKNSPISAEFITNGEKKSFGAFSVEAVQMSGPNHPQGNGYIFSADNVVIYVSGDTGANEGIMKLAGIDVAFVNFKPPYTWTDSALKSWAAAVKPMLLVPIHFLAGGEKSAELLKKDLKGKIDVLILKEME